MRYPDRTACVSFEYYWCWFIALVLMRAFWGGFGF